MYNLCCIGHITSDKVVTASATTYIPGGTAWYFSWAVSLLDLNYLLVTALAPAEMPYVQALRDKGIHVKVQPSTNTVYFENIYAEDQDQRSQNVLQTADPFTMQQLLDTDARLFHLGPLLPEDFSIAIIKTLAAKATLSLDVQGFLRRLEDKKVYAAGWPAKKEALQYIHTLKADVAELQALTGCNNVHDGARQLAAWGVKEAVITNGSKGSVIYSEGIFYTIPAYQPPLSIDATGCGDTYMAGYLYQRTKGAGIQQSGEFAAAMAGLKTVSSGPFNGTERDIEQFLGGF